MDAEAPVLVRDALPGDENALAALATHLGYPTDAAAMRGRFARIAALPDHRTLVAERGGHVVGMVGVAWGWTYHHDRPQARLTILVVEPGERARGTGAALVSAAEARAREAGADAVQVTTALHRAGAHRFYERIGYARTGLRYRKELV